MAISTRQVTSKNQAGATTIVLNKPAGVVSGDVMYAFIYEGNSNTHVTAPGWTEVAFRAVDASNCVTALRLVAGGSEPSTYTFTGNASGLINGHIVALIGVDNTTPEDATPTVNSGATSSVTAPTITTVTDNAWHLVSFETTGTQASLGLPSGYTNDVPTYGSGGDVARADHKNITPAGATGTAVSTADVAGNWIAISIAVRPGAPAVAGGIPFMDHRPIPLLGSPWMANTPLFESYDAPPIVAAPTIIEQYDFQPRPPRTFTMPRLRAEPATDLAPDQGRPEEFADFAARPPRSWTRPRLVVEQPSDLAPDGGRPAHADDFRPRAPRVWQRPPLHFEPATDLAPDGGRPEEFADFSAHAPRAWQRPHLGFEPASDVAVVVSPPDEIDEFRARPPRTWARPHLGFEPATDLAPDGGKPAQADDFRPRAPRTWTRPHLNFEPASDAPAAAIVVVEGYDFQPRPHFAPTMPRLRQEPATDLAPDGGRAAQADDFFARPRRTATRARPAQELAADVPISVIVEQYDFQPRPRPTTRTASNLYLQPASDVQPVVPTFGGDLVFFARPHWPSWPNPALIALNCLASAADLTTAAAPVVPYQTLPKTVLVWEPGGLVRRAVQM